MSRTSSTGSSLWKVLDERLGLGAFAYAVPRHANTFWYSLGALTLIAFVVLVVSGTVISQYYNPLPSQANHSVRYIIQDTAVGGAFRAIHYWAAQIMVVTLLLHLGRVFVTASYRRPREANWIIGVFLFFVTVGLYFSGTVLKWDQEGYEAMLHNMEGAELIGSLGLVFSDFARSVPMLVRLYIGHVSLLPAVLTLLVVAHFFLVKRHGISPSPWTGPVPEAGEGTFARHVRRVGAYSLVLVGGLLVLGALLPPGLGPAPVEGIEVTKPPWLLLPLYPLENLFGLVALLYAPLVLAVLLLAVPFIDREGPLRPSARRGIAGAGLAVALLTAASGLYAWWSVPQAHVGM